MDDCQSKTVEVRKIENGFVRRESESGEKGYHSRETFHKSHPGMGEKAKEPGAERVGKSMMKDALRALGK